MFEADHNILKLSTGSRSLGSRCFTTYSAGLSDGSHCRDIDRLLRQSNAGAVGGVWLVSANCVVHPSHGYSTASVAVLVHGFHCADIVRDQPRHLLHGRSAHRVFCLSSKDTSSRRRRLQYLLPARHIYRSHHYGSYLRLSHCYSRNSRQDVTCCSYRRLPRGVLDIVCLDGAHMCIGCRRIEKGRQDRDEAGLILAASWLLELP
jgi:hypothetical protein